MFPGKKGRLTLFVLAFESWQNFQKKNHLEFFVYS
jgi:hypothetical protein